MARLGRPGGLSAAGKKELWKRWRAGEESISDIARALQKPPGSIHGMLEATGGISPPERRRRKCALTPSEREEISRGLAAGESLRTIATRLGRCASADSASTIRQVPSRPLGQFRLTSPPVGLGPWTGHPRGGAPPGCRPASRGGGQADYEVCHPSLFRVLRRSELDEQLGQVGESAPALASLRCAGTDPAAALLVTAVDSPERLKSEAAFALLSQDYARDPPVPQVLRRSRGYQVLNTADVPHLSLAQSSQKWEHRLATQNHNSLDKRNET